MKEGELVTAGMALILLGFLVVFAGLMLSTRNSQGEVRGGGVVFLGPIPLVFGSDKNSAVTVSGLALVLMILAYFLFKR